MEGRNPLPHPFAMATGGVGPVIPPTSYEVETAKRKGTQTEAPSSLRRAIYGPFSASGGYGLLCHLLRVFGGTWGSVTSRTTGKARGKLQPH